MIMLDDLDRAVDREIEYRKSTGDTLSREDDDIVVSNFQKAARTLLARQVLHADGHLKSSYRLICRHEPYFSRLLHGFGYELTIDMHYEYIIVTPGGLEGATRRGRLRKDESLLLLTLRIMWEESSRDGEMDDIGRITVDTDSVLDRLTTLGGGEAPSKRRLKEMLDTWRSNGFLRVGEEDREEEIIPLTIMPAIRHLVTPALVKEIELFLNKTDPKGDVFKSIEDSRLATEEDINRAATERSRDHKEDPETDLFSTLTNSGVNASHA